MPGPSFEGLKPASEVSSHCKRMNGRSDTLHERLLRSALWKRGFRFRKNEPRLAGKPDIVFRRERVAVFCDGDFWHGRRWRRLAAKLDGGANASYWVEKIRTNMRRDRRNNTLLASDGWVVVRLWESDILDDLTTAAARVERVILRRRIILKCRSMNDRNAAHT